MTDKQTSNRKNVSYPVELVRLLSNTLAQYLHELPAAVWRSPDDFRSGSHHWNVADVVAHLISEAITFSQSLERGLNGITAPPLSYRPLTEQDAVSFRKILCEDIFPEFNTTCMRLNTLIASCTADQSELPVWSPDGVVSARELVCNRAFELAIHSWDIKSCFDRNTPLEESSIEFLKTKVRHWLQEGFSLRDTTEGLTIFRFLTTERNGEQYNIDIRMGGGRFQVIPSDGNCVDVTFECSVDNYLRLCMGRLDLDRSVRRGIVRAKGDQAVVSQFAINLQRG